MPGIELSKPGLYPFHIGQACHIYLGVTSPHHGLRQASLLAAQIYLGVLMIQGRVAGFSWLVEGKEWAYYTNTNSQ